jgi:hypothetical protein
MHTKGVIVDQVEAVLVVNSAHVSLSNGQTDGVGDTWRRSAASTGEWAYH